MLLVLQPHTEPTCARGCLFYSDNSQKTMIDDGHIVRVLCAPDLCETDYGAARCHDFSCAVMSEHSPQRPPARLSQRWQWGSKQPISFLMEQAVRNPQVISLAAGLVDQSTLPVAEVRSAC